MCLCELMIHVCADTHRRVGVLYHPPLIPVRSLLPSPGLMASLADWKSAISSNPPVSTPLWVGYWPLHGICRTLVCYPSTEIHTLALTTLQSALLILCRFLRPLLVKKKWVRLFNSSFGVYIITKTDWLLDPTFMCVKVRIWSVSKAHVQKMDLLHQCSELGCDWSNRTSVQSWDGTEHPH